MKLRKMVALSLTAISILSMAACGGGSSDKESKETKNDEDTIEINFFHRWPNDPKNSMFKELIAQYEKENPNVKINMDCILNDQYKEKIRMIVSTDEVPDIFSSWSGSFAQEMIDSGNVMGFNLCI